MVDISRTSFHGGYFMVYKPTYNWGAYLSIVTMGRFTLWLFVT